ncbi:MAG: DUF4062 domain-containing protein [Candidatus Thiodiazotropha sp.]
MKSNGLYEQERKYQVFISSPFSLQEVRQQVFRAVLMTNHIPIRMEETPATSRATREVIKSAIQKSDIYVLILGCRYGSLMHDEGGNMSFTEWEYNQAVASGAEILIYLLNETEIREKRRLLDGEKKHDSEELKNEDKFWRFYNMLREGDHFDNIWTEQDYPALSGAVGISVNNTATELFKKSPDRGLIPASSAQTLDIFTKALKNELRADVHYRFNKFVELDDRCADSKAEKKALAKHFVTYYIERIASKNVNLYFDTGSTSSYVAKELGIEVKRAKHRAYSSQKLISSVSTNCALTFLHLWLSSDIPATMFPEGPVEAPYGASHGPLSLYGEKSSSQQADYCRLELSPAEQKRIANLIKLSPRLNHEKETPVLIIGGVSGVKIADTPEPVTDDASNFFIDEEIRACIKRYRGFHVGDYHSMLFKRYLYETGLPIVVCMHYNKIHQPIKVGKCHLVFDDAYSWEQFLENYPFALCIGYDHNDESEVKDVLDELALTPLIPQRHDGSRKRAILVGNKKYLEWEDSITKA